jgi:hypothetical protein
MHGSQFTSAADARAFVLAGNALFTLVSKKTGTRFTYRVRQSKDGKVHFVALLNGPDNESDFAYMGTIHSDNVFTRTAKSRMSPNAPSFIAFAWAWKKLSAGQLPEDLEVWHEGHCGRCGRTLTVPASIERGIGPECARRTPGATPLLDRVMA